MSPVKKLLLALCMLSTGVLAAQESFRTTPEANINDQLSFGIGVGFDYGGFGANVLAYPHKNVGLFLGGGYAMAGFGFNAGAKIRIITQTKIHPYFIAMYGYNAAIAVTNATQYNKLFYAPTIGIGVDSHPRFKRNGYWSVALMIPIRSNEVTDYTNYLKTQGVVLKNSLSPVGISVGYHFIIH